MLTITLMIGLPGSGKTTLARQLAATHDAVVCSADDWFTRDGKYRWEHAGLPEAHAQCQSKARVVLATGRSVVIDNTNLKSEHRTVYIDMAVEFRARLVFALPTTPWAWNPAECAKHCTHAISEAAIAEMLVGYEAPTTVTVTTWIERHR